MTPRFLHPWTADEFLQGIAFIDAVHHLDKDAVEVLSADRDALIHGLVGVFLNVGKAIAEHNGEDFCDWLERLQSEAVATAMSRTTGGDVT